LNFNAVIAKKIFLVPYLLPLHLVGVVDYEIYKM